MHRIVLVVSLVGVSLSGVAWSQTMTEAAGAIAGGSVGGAAGKKVSEGISAIFSKVDTGTAKAAKPTNEKSTKSTPMLDVGPGVAKASDESVPPPPPLAGHRASAPKPAPVQELAPAEQVPAPPPPPPQVTAEDLKKVTTGMHREEVLRLGPPASRITMFEDGHVVEIYRYMVKDTNLGKLVLTDGAVSTIELL